MVETMGRLGGQPQSIDGRRGVEVVDVETLIVVRYVGKRLPLARDFRLQVIGSNRFGLGTTILHAIYIRVGMTEGQYTMQARIEDELNSRDLDRR